MTSFEETGTVTPVVLPGKEKVGESVLSRLLRLLCSVRLGIALLTALCLACLIGMLIMQENVEGFANYYASLTPAQRLVYGKLGFFDIYHVWYFNWLLALLSVNIILASIDRFPKTWTFVSKPQTNAPLRWLQGLTPNESFVFQGSRKDIVNRVSDACKKAGWRKVIVKEKGNRTIVLAQSGLWNRFAYLAVHVGLLTIFLGGFLTAQLGHTGQMPLAPGQTSNEILETVFDLDQPREITKRLPFEIVCTDIQQKLIRKEGSITASNTIDWLTHIKIKDEGETHEAVVQMNRPFDYRGYRFFQASFTPTGRARNITVRLMPANGGASQDVTIPRDGATTLADGTHIKFAEFRGKFTIGPEDPNEDTSDYPNPGAILQVTPPNGMPQTAYAFGAQMANIPAAKNPVGGYTYQLIDFEKVGDQHILSVQRDPGAAVVYVGFTLLFLTLVSVFFFSHQRVWASIEETAENQFQVVAGANTNRNQTALEEKFGRLVTELRTQIKESRT